MQPRKAQARAQLAEAGALPHPRQLSAGSADSGLSISVSLRTLLVTDVVHSTELVERLGDLRANEVLSRHERLARDLLVRFKGREIDKADGFLLLFEEPADAVDYALAYHRELDALSREVGVPLRARVGIHTGDVILRENSPEDVARGAKPLEVEGLAKPTAARVASLAGGRQTLLTRDAMDLARQRTEATGAGPASELRWLGHGSYPVKGLKKAIEIYEVGVSGVAPFAAPSREPMASRRRWILPWTVALLCLVLVAAFLSEQAGRFVGVVARPSVAVLGFKNLTPSAPETGWLSTALTEMLANELAAGEELRLIPGESVERMKRELDLPQSDTFAPDTLGAIRRNLGTDYVILGAYLVHDDDQGHQRLRLQPVLQATSDGETIAALNLVGSQTELFEIVSQAGSLLREELGIGELSAAELRQVRATVPSVPRATQFYAEGLARLRNYDALAARDVLEEAVAADPEYALAHAALSEAWRELGYDKKAQTSARRAFDLARGLPRESELLIHGRYYEAVSEWQKAIETYRVLWGFFPDAVDYGVRLAKVEIGGGRPRDALATVEALRQLPAPLSEDPRIDLAEASAAQRLADVERELAAVERAVETARKHDTKLLLALALHRRGIALYYRGESEKATESYEQARRLFAEHGDRGRLAQVLNSQAIQSKYQGDLAGAEELYRKALAIHQETGNRLWVSTLMNNLAVLIMEKGELAEARRMLDGALDIVRQIDNSNAQPYRLDCLGWVLFKQGDLAGAQAMARDARAGYETIGNQRGLAWNFYLEGMVAFAAGSITAARAHYETALGICEEIGDKKVAAMVNRALGELLTAAGDLDAARERLEDSREMLLELGDQGPMTETELARAVLELESGRAPAAAETARHAAAEVARVGRSDDRLVAEAVLARALLAQNRLAEARELLAATRASAEESESPAVRLSVALAGARLDAAAGDHEGAERELERIAAEAGELALTHLVLEARLARGEIGLSSPGEAATARSALEALAQEADARGFGLIARKARSAPR